MAVAVAGHHPLADVARTIERLVAAETGAAGAPPARDESDSRLVVVLDRERRQPPFVPLAGSPPLIRHGAAGIRPLYGDLARFETAFAEQAARLRRAARPGGVTVRGNDLKRLAVRRVAADIAGRLATGAGLDDRIILPA